MTKAEINKKWKKALKEFKKVIKLPTATSLQGATERQAEILKLLEKLTAIVSQFPTDVYFCSGCRNTIAACTCDGNGPLGESLWPPEITDMCNEALARKRNCK